MFVHHVLWWESRFTPSIPLFLKYLSETLCSLGLVFYSRPIEGFERGKSLVPGPSQIEMSLSNDQLEKQRSKQ